MATSQVETVNTGADKAKLAAVVALVIASVAGFYLLGKQGALVQWAALIVGLVAAAGVFLVSESGRQFVAFAKDAWREVKKVVWPTRKETIQMTGVVMAFVDHLYLCSAVLPRSTAYCCTLLVHLETTTASLERSLNNVRIPQT